MKLTITTATFFALFVLGTKTTAGPVDKGSSIVGGSFSFMQQSGDLYDSNGDALTTAMVPCLLAGLLAPAS